MMNVRESGALVQLPRVAHDTISVSDSMLCVLFMLTCYQITVKGLYIKKCSFDYQKSAGVLECID